MDKRSEVVCRTLEAWFSALGWRWEGELEMAPSMLGLALLQKSKVLPPLKELFEVRLLPCRAFSERTA